METRNHVLTNIPAKDLEALAPHLRLTELASGEVLHEPERRVDRVYFPNTAVLSVVMVMEDGRTVETDTVGFESAVGLVAALASSTSVDRAFTQIPGTAFALSAARLREQADQSPALRQVLMRHAQANLAQAHQSVACNALHGVEQRLCRWLLASYDRTDREVIELTQQYLAIMVGVQRTTITQTLRELTDAGLIRQGRGQIRIVNLKGLKARACECYDAMLAHMDRLIGEDPMLSPAKAASRAGVR